MYSDINPTEPLALEQLNKVTQVIQGFSPQQKLWLSGYLAGLSTVDAPKITNSNFNSQPQLTILYASQTGNGRLLAENYFQQSQAKGVNCQLFSMADYRSRDISKEKYLVIIISTHGEGDAPDDAEIFYEYLFSGKKLNLSSLSYSLLALGDSSYEKFCQTGIDIDHQLKKLGAQSVVERIDCDLNYEEKVISWQTMTLEYFSKSLNGSESNITPLSLIKPKLSNGYNRNNTYSAEILTLQKITTQSSIKNTYHIELDIEGSSIEYQAGDTLGIVAKNNNTTIDTFIYTNGLDPDKTVSYKEAKQSFKQLLATLEISLINKSFLKFYTKLSQSDALNKIIGNHQSFLKYVSERQLSDVLQDFPTNISEQQIVDNLIKITPRLYSISSSYHLNQDEVHLTVSLVTSTINDQKNGLVSGLLCDQLIEGDRIDVYVQNNQNFKLPQESETPIIMIAAGTGIAPFRGFLQERQSINATGKNWLFFGNPSFDNDFLYQLELQKFYDKNILTHIDLAFSRDQKQKIYVQQRIKQNAKEIWQWLKNGSHIYICGNKNNMAKAVEAELLSLIEVHGNMDIDQAKNYLTTLKRNKRYQKDVY